MYIPHPSGSRFAALACVVAGLLCVAGSWSGAATADLSPEALEMHASFDRMEAYFDAHPELKTTPGSGWNPYNRARDYLEQSEFPGKVVVVVEAEVQAGADVLNRANPDFLRENAFLLLKHSQRKVGLQQYVSPLQYGGGEAFFVFPREEEGRTLITLEEKEVRFICQINRDARIERKFKLDKMVFDGVLEL